MNKVIFSFLLILCSLYLTSCNQGKDTSELWAKSQSRGDIIARSGTTFQAGSDASAKEAQMNDAQNRLRTGGGLLGQKPTELNNLLGGGNNQSQTSSIGMPINPYLWKASIDTLDFMPFASADPFAGIIITDWYTGENKKNERCKINVFIKGMEMKTDNLKVNSFCQSLSESGSWIDQKLNLENNRKLENAILNKAKKLRLSKS